MLTRARSHGVEVTHDYATEDGAIPLPATFSKMLGERIAAKGSGGYVELYSDYPLSVAKGQPAQGRISAGSAYSTTNKSRPAILQNRRT